MARVEGKKVTDYVYLSDDDKERTIDGLTFSGTVAHVRVDNDSTGQSTAGKKPHQGNGKCDGQVSIYTYGDATVRCGRPGKTKKTKAISVEGQVTATTSRNDGTATGGSGTANVITVDQKLRHAKDLAGRWMTVQAADGSGWAFKIVKVQSQDVHVEVWLPFERTKDGLRRSFVPFKGATTK